MTRIVAHRNIIFKNYHQLISRYEFILTLIGSSVIYKIKTIIRGILEMTICNQLDDLNRMVDSVFVDRKDIRMFLERRERL